MNTPVVDSITIDPNTKSNTKSNKLIVGYNIDDCVYGEFKKIKNKYIMIRGAKLDNNANIIEMYDTGVKITARVHNYLNSLTCEDNKGLKYIANFGIDAGSYDVRLVSNDELLFKYSFDFVETIVKLCVDKDKLIEEPEFDETMELPIYAQGIDHFNKLLSNKKIREYIKQLQILCDSDARKSKTCKSNVCRIISVESIAESIE